jgi:copper chaperone CopZ
VSKAAVALLQESAEVRVDLFTPVVACAVGQTQGNAAETIPFFLCSQVEFDPSRVQPEELITAIEDAGFEGSVVSVRALAPAAGKEAAAKAGGKSSSGGKGMQTVHTGVLTVKNMTAQKSCEEVQALLMKVGGVLRAVATPQGSRVELLYLSGSLQQVCGYALLDWHCRCPTGFSWESLTAQNPGTYTM